MAGMLSEACLFRFLFCLTFLSLGHRTGHLSRKDLQVEKGGDQRVIFLDFMVCVGENDFGFYDLLWGTNKGRRK